MQIRIYTDGASRGNPGSSASGYSIYSRERVLKEDAFYNGTRTNNYAEYMAAIAALRWCKENAPADSEITVFSDSQLLVNQMNGSYKVKSIQMKQLNGELRGLSSCFGRVEFKCVPRSNTLIARVDRRLNLFLDGR